MFSYYINILRILIFRYNSTHTKTYNYQKLKKNNEEKNNNRFRRISI